MTRKTYAQYCGLARALDIVGERWSLLIVRELLIRPARYGDLLSALPGVATNLLAERLRSLEAAGVIERQLDPASHGVLYALTSWGAGLREAVEALMRWSTPLMVPGPGADSERPQWLALAVSALLAARTAEPPATVGFDVAGTLLAVRLDAAGPHVTIDPLRRPPTVLRAESQVVLGLLAGALTVEQAIAAGILDGEPAPLAAILG